MLATAIFVGLGLGWLVGGSAPLSPPLWPRRRVKIAWGPFNRLTKPSVVFAVLHFLQLFMHRIAGTTVNVNNQNDLYEYISSADRLLSGLINLAASGTYSCQTGNCVTPALGDDDDPGNMLTAWGGNTLDTPLQVICDYLPETPSCTLNGLKNHAILSVLGHHMKIRGVKFFNGLYNSGGGLSLDNSRSSVILEMCRFEGCESTISGNAITVYGGTLNAYATTFHHSHGRGTIYVENKNDYGAQVFLFHTCPEGWGGTPSRGDQFTDWILSAGNILGENNSNNEQIGPGGFNLHNYQRGTCNSCSAGTKFNDGTGNCDVCGPGKYSEGGALSCIPCEVGLYSGSASNSCSSCEAGKKLINTATGTESSACTVCGGGQYSASASATCSSCQAGKRLVNTATGTESSACRVCEHGKYSTGAVNTCSNCAAGKYITDNGSTQTSHDEVSDCQNCDEGKTSVEGSPTCSGCVAGSFLGSGGCEDCLEGQYSGADSASCTSCAAGKRCVDIITGIENDACKHCGEGKYSGEASNECTACVAGKVRTQVTSGLQRGLHFLSFSYLTCRHLLLSIAHNSTVSWWTQRSSR